MARVFYYVTMMVGIFALFTIIGLPGSTTSQLISAVGGNDVGNYQNSSFWQILFGSTTGLIALFSSIGTVIVGFFLKQSFSETAVAGFVGVLGGWIIGDMISVLTTMKAQMGASGAEFGFIYQITWFFLIIFIAGAVLSLISWWRNSET